MTAGFTLKKNGNRPVQPTPIQPEIADGANYICTDFQNQADLYAASRESDYHSMRAISGLKSRRQRMLAGGRNAIKKKAGKFSRPHE